MKDKLYIVTYKCGKYGLLNYEYMNDYDKVIEYTRFLKDHGMYDIDFNIAKYVTEDNMKEYYAGNLQLKVKINEDKTIKILEQSIDVSKNRAYLKTELFERIKFEDVDYGTDDEDGDDFKFVDLEDIEIPKLEPIKAEDLPTLEEIYADNVYTLNYTIYPDVLHSSYPEIEKCIGFDICENLEYRWNMLNESINLYDYDKEKALKRICMAICDKINEKWKL